MTTLNKKQVAAIFVKMDNIAKISEEYIEITLEDWEEFAKYASDIISKGETFESYELYINKSVHTNIISNSDYYMTLEEIAKKLNLSRTRIGKITEEAMHKLQKNLRKKDLLDFL